MDKIKKFWHELDVTTRVGIGCFALYMFLYIWLDIVEAVFGLAM